MQGEMMRECLHAGTKVYGTHVSQMGNASAVSILADSAGLDFVFLCTEHMPLDRTETAAMCTLFAAKGVSPIVRLSHPSAKEAAQALDCGAQGIVAPYVETVAQVQELVGAVHYRPAKGKQLAEYLSGERKLNTKMQAFFKRFNRQNYAIIGVESVAAYENLDQLISVPGVDGVFIGPHDITVSLEHPEEWDYPPFHRLLDDTVARCRAANLGVGVHIPGKLLSLERVQELIGLGMNWVLDGADVIQSRDYLQRRRETLGIASAPDNKAFTAPASITTCAAVE